MIKKYWGFNMPTDILKRLRLAAAKCGISMATIVLSALEWELDRIDKTPVNDGVKKDAI